MGEAAGPKAITAAPASGSVHENGQFAMPRPGRLAKPNWRDPAALKALPTAAFRVGRLYEEESDSRGEPA